ADRSRRHAAPGDPSRPGVRPIRTWFATRRFPPAAPSTAPQAAAHPAISTRIRSPCSPPGDVVPAGRYDRHDDRLPPHLLLLAMDLRVIRAMRTRPGFHVMYLSGCMHLERDTAGDVDPADQLVLRANLAERLLDHPC